MTTTCRSPISESLDAVSPVAAAEPGLTTQLVSARRLYRVVPGATGDGLQATYFDRADLTGMNVTRVDKTIDLDWSRCAPVSGFRVDTCSVRWSGYLVPPTSGTYTLTVRTEEGVQLWIDGVAVINAWRIRAEADRSGSVTLIAGQRHRIEMEWFDSATCGVAQLYWAGPGIARQIVPQKYFYSR